MNTVKKIEEESAKNIDISKTFKIVGPKDLEEFEFEIREDERRKIYEANKRKRERMIKYREAKKKLFLLSLVPRFAGCLLLYLTFVMLHGPLVDDGTFALLTIPLSFLLIILPGGTDLK